LASVGLGRREEDRIDNGQPAKVQPQMSRPTARPATQPQRTAPAQPRAAQPVVRPQPKPETPLYRPSQGDLDPHGRPVPATRTQDDELEIPAFLRRQTN
jgi:cell division protein FtsZ